MTDDNKIILTLRGKEYKNLFYIPSKFMKMNKMHIDREYELTIREIKKGGMND